MGKIENKHAERKAATKEILKQRKKKAKKNKKRARILVKNLAFTTTEDLLKQHFGQYGNVEEITLLKKPDGSLVGCAFIQFELVQKAAKAIHYTNDKPFLDRVITVEWAKPKDKYKNKNQDNEVNIKEEPLDEYDPNIQIKTEKIDKTDLIKKEEPEDDNDENLTFEIVKDSSNLNEGSNENSNKEVNDKEPVTESEKIGSESENDTSSEDDSSSEDEKKEEESNIKTTEEEKEKKRFISNDANEGRTVFIKNVPFDATNDDLAECMSQFGPFYYALICIDRLTEHSKGTAFVKFKQKEDAEKCLDAKDLILLGNVLDCQMALTKNDLEQKVKENSDRKSKQNDSRNLYLVKEGVILAGSKAAEGVSETDMAKRLQLEQYKTQMLRNLNMFISRYRIVVHNLPLNWDNDKLKSLCALHVGPKAVIKESRIMRDMRDVDAKGVGKSKGFGFVSFSTHEDALQCLRSLNNNPNVFSPKKRPIVTFSIENKTKILTKERRQFNSRIKNPLSKDYNKKFTKKKEKVSRFDNRKRKVDNGGDEEMENFAGVASKPGDLGFKKMRSNFHLKNQAKLHHQNVKEHKKLKKNTKKTLNEKAKDFTKQPRQKLNKKKMKTGDDFSKMVSQYKKKIIAGSSDGDIFKKSRWYNSSNS